MKTSEQFEHERAIEELNNPKPKCRISGCNNDCRAFNDRCCLIHTPVETPNSQEPKREAITNASEISTLHDESNKQELTIGSISNLQSEPKSACCGKDNWDGNCILCDEPFTPASKKECICFEKLTFEGLCPFCSTLPINCICEPKAMSKFLRSESLDWRTAEREKFKTFSTIVSIEVVRDPSKDIEKIICDYWILRIEQARKEGYDILLSELKTADNWKQYIKIEVEQGKQEAIKEINKEWLSLELPVTGNKEQWDKELTRFSLFMQELSANLTSDE